MNKCTVYGGRSSKFGNWKLRQRVRRSQCGGYPGHSPSQSRTIEPRCLHCFGIATTTTPPVFFKMWLTSHQRCNSLNVIFSLQFVQKKVEFYVAFSWKNKIIHCEHNFLCAKHWNTFPALCKIDMYTSINVMHWAAVPNLSSYIIIY